MSAASGLRAGMFVIVVDLVALSSIGRADRHVDHDGADRPVVQAVYGSAPPVLDGRLDDPVWSRAALLDDFYCHDLSRAPSESTLVWLAYDRENIYLAARCFDRQPARVHMEETKRGSDLSKDDHISFELDIEHQHRYEGAFSFVVTPRGVQSEDIPDGSAAKIEWRGDWRAVASVDSGGWSVEAAIPLAMFNLPAGKRTVGVSVKRWLARTQEEIRWPNMGERRDRMRTGDWLDLDWPLIRRRPIFMPYVLGGRAGGANERALGLDVKYVTSHGLTFAATANPDTRNVESEVLDLDFSYTERSRQDNRPFFVEGGEYLPPAPYFYTQRVGSMYGGAKLFGQIGVHRLGLLDAYELNRVNHFAASVWSQPKPGVEFHQLASWWHGPGDAARRDGAPLTTDNILYTSDFTYRRLARGTEEYWYAQTRLTSTKGDTGDGIMAEVGWGQWDQSGIPGIHIVLRQTSAGYLPFDALHDLSDSNVRELYVEGGYWFLRDSATVRKVGVWGDGRKAHRLNGGLYDQFVNASAWIETDSHLSFSLTTSLRERPRYRDRTVGTELEWNTNSLYARGQVEGTFGSVRDAGYLNLSIEQGVRPWEHLGFHAAGQYIRWDYPVSHALKPNGGLEHEYQLRGTVQWDITHEQSLSGRVIRSGEGWNSYLAYRRSVRRGVDLFLILGDPSAATWAERLVLKAMVVL